MDRRKIFIANLSKGTIGADKSNLLGSVLVTKFELAAMRRATMPEQAREDFYLYIDEFHNFATDSFASILSEATEVSPEPHPLSSVPRATEAGDFFCCVRKRRVPGDVSRRRSRCYSPRPRARPDLCARNDYRDGKLRNLCAASQPRAPRARHARQDAASSWGELPPRFEHRKAIKTAVNLYR